MNIAVLMTCHNRRETTIGCLESLVRAIQSNEKNGGDGEKPQWNVFIVDDGSTDGTGEEIVRLFDCSDCLTVRLIQGDGNLYWAKGMALAWREALKYEGRVRSSTPTFNFNSFLWLNDDVELDETAVETLLGAHHQDPAAVIVGAMREVVTGKKVYGIMDSGLMTGNVVLVPRAVFDKVGVICGEYRHAWADCDYALRCKRENVEIREVGPVGTCSWHEFRPRLDGYGLGWRLRTLFDPKGWCVHDVWLFRRRNFGVVRAFASSANLVRHVLLSGWNFWHPLYWVACRMPRWVQKNLWRGLRFTRMDRLLNDEGFCVLQLLCVSGERYALPAEGGGLNSVITWQRLNWQSLVPKVCSDKLAVRDYVRARCGDAVLNKIYPVDRNALPSAFVLKCSTGSGMNLIVRDKEKLDWDNVETKMKRWEGSDYSRFSRERQYEGVKPRVFAEELLQSENGELANDYKFMCTDGEVLFCRVDEDRFGAHKRACYSRDGEKLDVRVGYDGDDYPISEAALPTNWQEMVDIAEKLSRGIPLVRVDLYSVLGKVVFGEMTFTSGGGFEGIRPFAFSQEMAKKVRGIK